MPEQVSCCDNQTVSLGIEGFESDERPYVLCSEADALSVPLPFTIPNLFLVVGDNMV